MLLDKKVAIVIVTYNRKDLLRECLEALTKQTYQSISIYIIDNASTDGTKDAIVSFLQRDNVNYFNTEVNLGGAGGFNYGMNLAAHTDCDYIWIMDDDTIPDSDSLEELMKAVDEVDDDFGFLSSYAKYIDGTYCRMNRQLVEQRKWIEGYELIKDGLLRIQRATFVSMLIKKEIVFQEGLPIKEFFVWGDDTEYTLRLSGKYNCYLVTESVVTHKTSQNVDTGVEIFINESNKDKLDRYFYNYRNWCYISRVYHQRYDNIKRFLRLNRGVLFKCKSLKLKKLATVWKGYLAGLVFRPKVELPSQ